MALCQTLMSLASPISAARSLMSLKSRVYRCRNWSDAPTPAPNDLDTAMDAVARSPPRAPDRSIMPCLIVEAFTPNDSMVMSAWTNSANSNGVVEPILNSSSSRSLAKLLDPIRTVSLASKASSCAPTWMNPFAPDSIPPSAFLTPTAATATSANLDAMPVQSFFDFLALPPAAATAPPTLRIAGDALSSKAITILITSPAISYPLRSTVGNTGRPLAAIWSMRTVLALSRSA